MPHGLSIRADLSQAGRPEGDTGRSRPRLDSVDFWRGYLLCTIFINHVPGNLFEPLTQKNFGFSDSAEGFVFLSGVSLALAYGRRFAGGDWSGVTRKLMTRSIALYGLHVLLSMLGLAIFAAGAFWGDSALMQSHGRDLVAEAPRQMLIGLLTLGHQFGYFNILPMYILLVVTAPALLWMGRGKRWPMLAASFGLYVLANAFGWNLPTWPIKGTWFFNPFAWQFMLALGMTLGAAGLTSPVPRSPPLLCLAGAVVGFGAFSVTDGFSFWPGIEHWTRGWAGLDKTTLGLGRVVHFLAMAYLLYGLRVTERLRRTVLFRPICCIGRNGLWMFSLLSLMAAGTQVATALLGHRVLTDVAAIVAGLVALYVAARLIEGRQQAGLPLGARFRQPAIELARNVAGGAWPALRATLFPRSMMRAP